MIVVIDHFDSFVETLARYIAEAGFAVQVIRQDSTPEAVLALDPQAVVLSPGPGRPETTGLTLPLLQKLPRNVPVLGICLGHQALAQHLGGSVGHAQEPRHGKLRRSAIMVMRCLTVWIIRLRQGVITR